MAATIAPRDAVELFHLLFLRALTAGANKSRVILKGGCNLRFFFGSPRYSEDLDLDVDAMPAGTLRNAVERTLTSPLLLQPLRARGITLAGTTAPKQTEVTQRWKLALAVEGASAALRTKVEFSHRSADPAGIVEAVDPLLLRRHGLGAILVRHYPAAVAIRQKVRALAQRTQTQARDVFDLQLLLSRPGPPPELPEAELRNVKPAVARALTLTFADFTGQVVAYLTPDFQSLYSDEGTWDQLQLEVVERLEALAA